MGWGDEITLNPPQAAHTTYLCPGVTETDGQPRPRQQPGPPPAPEPNNIPVMKHLLILLLLIPGATIGQSGTRPAKAADKSGELILSLRPGQSVTQLLQTLADPQLRTADWRFGTLSAHANIHRIILPPDMDTTAASAVLRRHPGVAGVSGNAPVQFRDSLPDDPVFPEQWNLERIGLPSVWDAGTGGSTAAGDEIVVAVLDKGFDISHEELQPNLWRNPGEIAWDGLDNDGNGLVDDVFGWNFRDRLPTFSPEKHGTEVCGVIGARGNNGIGIAGVNWRVRILLLGVQYVDEVVAAFEYVRSMRERYNQSGGTEGAFIVVTNASIGIDKQPCSSYPAWGQMFDSLGEAGILSVAATANENWDVDELGDIPTSCPSEFLVTVTNSNQDDRREANAAFGRQSIDLSAPGKKIITTSTGNTYNESFSGTSAASPHVAAGIALLYAMPCQDLAGLVRADPPRAARLIRDAVLQSTDPLQDLQETTATGGRLNLFHAMENLHAWCISDSDRRRQELFPQEWLAQPTLLRLYPNPTRDLLTVEYATRDLNPFLLRCYNVFGQLVRLQDRIITPAFQAQRFLLDTSEWPAGTYFLHVPAGDRTVVQKFIKQ
jgi:hypothetical protein